MNHSAEIAALKKRLTELEAKLNPPEPKPQPRKPKYVCARTGVEVTPRPGTTFEEQYGELETDDNGNFVVPSPDPDIAYQEHRRTMFREYEADIAAYDASVRGQKAAIREREAPARAEIEREMAKEAPVLRGDVPRPAAAGRRQAD